MQERWVLPFLHTKNTSNLRRERLDERTLGCTFTGLISVPQLREATRAGIDPGERRRDDWRRGRKSGAATPGTGRGLRSAARRAGPSRTSGRTPRR